ncbi:MAG: hypothetical protein JWP61_2250, partial [Friedmanniella sp.]|nr:hypothetical protein [Friedmanniella sp.]
TTRPAPRPEARTTRRERRRRAADDFGDFSDLRDPDERPADRRPL